MKTRKASILILILICTLTLTCCTNTSKQTQNINDKPQAVILYIGEKQIDINNATDVQNIYAILKSMKISSKTNNTEQGIKGEFIFDKNTKQKVTFDEGRIVVDDKIYEGLEQSLSIINILNKYIYDKKYLAEAVREADIIQLTAADMSKEVVFNDKEKGQLITILTNSDIKYSDFLDAPIVPDFPEYSIKLSKGDKENVYATINIIKPTIINVVNNDTANIYSATDELWNMANSIIIPQKTSDLNKPTYLFNAQKVEINDGLKFGLGSGDYSKRLLWIVRLLKDGQPGIDNEPKGDKLTLVFTIENKIYNVDIYKDSYSYNNKFFTRPNILDEIKGLLIAG